MSVSQLFMKYILEAVFPYFITVAYYVLNLWMSTLQWHQRDMFLSTQNCGYWVTDDANDAASSLPSCSSCHPFYISKKGMRYHINQMHMIDSEAVWA